MDDPRGRHVRAGGDLLVPVRHADARPEPALGAAGCRCSAPSLLVSAPIVGLLLTLIAWGALADRYGERVVIVTRCRRPARCCSRSPPSVHGLGVLAVLLALGGACAASVNAASGRVVMGWFPREERGLAMGTRQTAQPLGVAVAALVLPPLAGGARTAARAAGSRPRCARWRRCSCSCSSPIRRVPPPRGSRGGRRRTAGRGRCRASISPAACSSCRSSRSPRSRSTYLVGSGTGTRPSPAGGCSASRPPARPGGSWPACGRTGCAAGCVRCGSWPSRARC